MTVNSYLRGLSSELVLSSEEKSSIQTSVNTLQGRLESHFGYKVKEHFKFGSSTRGTILPRKADKKSDIDYMVVFNTDDGEKKPQTYLDNLRKFAEEKYSTSLNSQSYPTIILSLNHINFELVPAIKTWGKYKIPSPQSNYFDWIDTDPAGINESLVYKNRIYNYLITPLVRLVKYWNASQGAPLPSFSLEQAIIDMGFPSDGSLNDYFYSFWSQYNCPYSVSNATKDKVERAKKYAREANQNELDGYSTLAEVEIKKIVPAL